MARDLQDSELYNGSAAYQIYPDYQGTAAPEIEHQGLPEERRLPQKKKRVKAKSAVSPFAVVGLAVVTCLIILVVFGYVQLYEASEQVSTLESQLSSLQEDQVVLESLYEEGIDLPYIEERAAELGLSGDDQAEIYASESTNIFQRIIQAIERSARGLVEYLS